MPGRFLYRHDLPFTVRAAFMSFPSAGAGPDIRAVRSPFALKAERNVMRISKRLAGVALAAGMVMLGAGLQPGGAPARGHHNGPVWDVSFIRVKPGMDEAYMAYLCGQWKSLQEAMKKEGLVLSYKVIGTEAHSAGDFNMMLMTEYKDLASMEANESKADSIAQRVAGDDAKQMQGYKDRSEVREVIGTRLTREIILEPKAK